jgi:hypothetical protein
VVRGERDRPQWDLRSRCCYLPVAFTKVRDTSESVQLLSSRALIRPRKVGLAEHGENHGTESSNPLPSSGESISASWRWDARPGGSASGLGALLAGRFRANGWEREIIGVGAFVTAFVIYPLSPYFGLFGLSVGLTLAGLLSGPVHVGMLTLRQRRTEPGWLGRVLAVSMSLNASGIPIGWAIDGWRVTQSAGGYRVPDVLDSRIVVGGHAPLQIVAPDIDRVRVPNIRVVPSRSSGPRARLL